MFPILSIGPVSLPVPGLTLLAGFWLGSAVAQRKSRATGVDPAFLDRLLWICLVAGLVGARLSYLARYPAAFKGEMLSLLSINPSLLDPLGGILIAAALGYYLVSRAGKDALQVLDSLTPFLAALIAAVHFSRFASGSHFGIPASLPWAVYLWDEFRHPVQIYYLAASLAVLLVIISARNVKIKGRLFYSFLASSGAYLLFLSRYQVSRPALVFPLRLDQIAYWTLLLIGLVFIGRNNTAGSEVTQYET